MPKFTRILTHRFLLISPIKICILYIKYIEGEMERLRCVFSMFRRPFFCFGAREERNKKTAVDNIENGGNNGNFFGNILQVIAIF